jgi:hypothetical protein
MMRWPAFTLATCSLLAACSRPDDAPPEADPAVPPSPAPAAQAEPEPPWFVGPWEARFRTEAHQVGLDRKRGAPREWEEGKDPRCLGEVTLSLEVDDAGMVQGSGTGALGAVSVQGVVEGDALRARLSPTEAAGFHGSLTATRTDPGLTGELRASSGDSLELCKATVTLARKP